MGPNSKRCLELQGAAKKVQALLGWNQEGLLYKVSCTSDGWKRSESWLDRRNEKEGLSSIKRQRLQRLLSREGAVCSRSLEKADSALIV